MPFEPIRRDDNGSIDFRFYHEQASQARREVRNETLKGAFATLKQIARTFGARDGENPFKARTA